MCVCPSSILNTTTNRSKFCNKLTTNQTWSLLLSLKCFLRCSSLGFGKISFTCTLITREVQARHDLLYGHGVHLRAFQYLLYISDRSHTFQAFPISVVHVSSFPISAVNIESLPDYFRYLFLLTVPRAISFCKRAFTCRRSLFRSLIASSRAAFLALAFASSSFSCARSVSVAHCSSFAFAKVTGKDRCDEITVVLHLRAGIPFEPFTLPPAAWLH
jgi:hypothetical protein